MRTTYEVQREAVTCLRSHSKSRTSTGGLSHEPVPGHVVGLGGEGRVLVQEHLKSLK